MIRVMPIKKEFRAVVHVDRDLIGQRHVMGASTEDGPWVEGRGKTPEAAVRDMYARIGECYTVKRLMSQS